jgi:hypothetical protein
MNEIEKSKGEIVIYQNNDNDVSINVRLEEENVWLTSCSKPPAQTSSNTFSTFTRRVNWTKTQPVGISDRFKWKAADTECWTLPTSNGTEPQNARYGTETPEKTKIIAGVITILEIIPIFVSVSCLTLCTAPQNAEIRTVAKSLPTLSQVLYNLL